MLSGEHLLRYALSTQGRKSIPSPPHLMLWGIENGARHPNTWLKRNKESKVYFQLPDSLSEAEKVILPFEGDYCFF